MFRLFAIVALLMLLVPRARAGGADEQYVQIYSLIQDGDALGTNQAALGKYTAAQTALQRFQKIYPGWNDRVVTFRLNYLASKITILSGGKIAPAVIPLPVKPASLPVPQTAAAPVQSSPAAPARAMPASVVAPKLQAPPANDLQNQIADLQSQLRQVQNDKLLLQAKLRESLAARPAAIDPGDLARAQERIRAVQKENDLLQVSLAEEKSKAAKVASPANSTELAQVKQELAETKRQLADQTARATQLAQENVSLQSRIRTLATNDEALSSLRMENEILKTLVDSKKASKAPAVDGDTSRQLAEAQAKIAELESDKEVWRLEKIALQDRVKELSVSSAVAANPVWAGESAHEKQLERERDELQRKLDAAEKELYGRNGKATAARVDQLAEQLETLRARLEVYESTPVPYSAEELALFKKPEVAVTDPLVGKRSIRELPPGTVELIAQAQRDFSAKSYGDAEQKYLQVLRRDDRNADALANLAAIQLQMGHLEDAEKNIKAALAVAPSDAYSLSILGNLKFRQEKYDEALDVLSRAAKLDPKNAEVENFLGLTLSQKGMRNAAETAFRKAVILDPNYGGAQNNLAVFYLTQIPPSIELARWHYQRALACGFPRNPDMEKVMNEKETAQNGQ